MKEYLFIFGRDPELSFLELTFFLNARKKTYEIKEVKKEVAVVKLEELHEDLANILGGTVRIGEVIAKNVEDLEQNKLSLWNKMRLSLCVYANASSYQKVKEYLKKRCKEESIKYILSKNTAPSKLKKEYLEILVFKEYIAKTISLFNPSPYKEREKRPYNDYLKSTSIRLARILIHLSGKEKGTLLDPFCGTGIILQEAILLGYNVLGIDRDKGSVMGAQKNIEWIKQKYHLKGECTIIQGDARKIPFHQFDVITTEPYLGPYIRGTLSSQEVHKIKRQLEELYREFFKNLKPCRIVFILPRFQTKKETIRLTNVLKEVKILQGPIPYADEKSKFIREIYVLEKIKVASN